MAAITTAPPLLHLRERITVAITTANIFRITAGPTWDETTDASLIWAFTCLVAIVPRAVESLELVAINIRWTQRLQRALEQGIPPWIRFYTINLIDRLLSAEIIFFTVITPTLSSLASLAIPANYLDRRLTRQLLTLPNLRILRLLPPIRGSNFLSIQDRVVGRLVRILHRVETLQKLTFPVDILPHIAEILHAASVNPILRAIEVLGPVLFQVNGRNIVLIESGLLGGLEQLLQLSAFTVPLNLLTPALLATLGRLPRLRTLKIRTTANISPGPAFLNLVLQSMIHLMVDFPSLDMLDMNLSTFNDSASRDTLRMMFPHVAIT